MANLFDLDDSLVPVEEKYDKLLRKANLYLLREDYDEALKIYEDILKEDMECLAAYIGILRVHSKDYSVYEGEDIEKDIRVILKVFDDIDNEDFINYITKRKRYFQKVQEEKAEQEEKARAEAEARAKAEAERKAKLEEEERIKREEAAKRQAEEDRIKAEKLAKNSQYGFNYDGYSSTLNFSFVCDNRIFISGPVRIPGTVKKFIFDDVCGAPVRNMVFDEGVEYILGVTKHNHTYQDYLIDSIVLPSTLKEIGDYAFFRCGTLKSLTIPNGTQKIGSEAFFGCKSLKEIKLPSTPVTLSDHTFASCSGLESIVLPEYISQINFCLFDGCTSLKTVTMSNRVNLIGSYAFRGCKSLASINIPNGVLMIPEATFLGCSSLSSVTIPDSVTRIEEFCFGECASLTSITLPKNLKFLGSCAFHECRALGSVSFRGTKSDWYGVTVQGCFDFDRDDIVIHCIDGDVTPYH